MREGEVKGERGGGKRRKIEIGGRCGDDGDGDGWILKFGRWIGLDDSELHGSKRGSTDGCLVSLLHSAQLGAELKGTSTVTRKVHRRVSSFRGAREKR